MARPGKCTYLDSRIWASRAGRRRKDYVNQSPPFQNALERVPSSRHAKEKRVDWQGPARKVSLWPRTLWSHHIRATLRFHLAELLWSGSFVYEGGFNRGGRDRHSRYGGHCGPVKTPSPQAAQSTVLMVPGFTASHVSSCCRSSLER